MGDAPDRMPTICLACGEPIPHEQYPEHVRACDSTALARKVLASGADQAQSGLFDVAASTLVELTGAERDAIGLVRHLCNEIVDGDR